MQPASQAILLLCVLSVVLLPGLIGRRMPPMVPGVPLLKER